LLAANDDNEHRHLCSGDDGISLSLYDAVGDVSDNLVATSRGLYRFVPN
jgi:hypothetical protein